MKRYLKILFVFGKTSIINIFEYRVNLFLTGSSRFLEALVSFLIIYFLLQRVNSIHGWDKEQVLLINLTFTLVTSIVSFFIWPGIKEYARSLNKGNIDNYLLRPINFQFFISVFRWNFEHMFKIVFTILAIIGVGSQINLKLDFLDVVQYVYLIVIAMITLYSFGFILVTSVIFFKRINNIDYLAVILLEPGKMPTSIFKGFLFIVFATIVPIYLAATVPVGVLTGKLSGEHLLYGTVVALIFLFSSHFFFKLGIKRYTGEGQ